MLGLNSRVLGVPDCFDKIVSTVQYSKSLLACRRCEVWYVVAVARGAIAGRAATATAEDATPTVRLRGGARRRWNSARAARRQSVAMPRDASELKSFSSRCVAGRGPVGHALRLGGLAVGHSAGRHVARGQSAERGVSRGWAGRGGSACAPCGWEASLSLAARRVHGATPPCFCALVSLAVEEAPDEHRVQREKIHV